MALTRDNKTWKLAQILEVRYKRAFDSDEEPYEEDLVVKQQPIQNGHSNPETAAENNEEVK